MRSAVLASLFFHGILASSVAGAFDDNFPNAPILAARDVTVLETALYNISNATAALNTDIDNFSVKTIFSLQTASNSLVTTINTADTEVAPTGPINTQGALALTPIIQQLATTVNHTVANLIAHKPVFGGITPIILASLKQQQTATLAFTKTTESKLPSDLVSASATLTEPIFEALASGIAAFSTPNINYDTSTKTSAAALGAAASYMVIAFAVIAGFGAPLMGSLAV